jgi:hypothetical protein
VKEGGRGPDGTSWKISREWVDVGSKEEDALGPLRRAMGRIAGLNEAVNLAKAAPEEGQLRDLGRKLGVSKKELMALGRVLVTNQVPTQASEAHFLAR